LVKEGRLPITHSNIEIVPASGSRPVYEIVHEKSQRAGLTIIGFRVEHIKNGEPITLTTTPNWMTFSS
jgi:hypothetical protein